MAAAANPDDGKTARHYSGPPTVSSTSSSSVDDPAIYTPPSSAATTTTPPTTDDKDVCDREDNQKPGNELSLCWDWEITEDTEHEVSYAGGPEFNVPERGYAREIEEDLPSNPAPPAIMGDGKSRPQVCIPQVCIPLSIALVIVTVLISSALKDQRIKVLLYAVGLMTLLSASYKLAVSIQSCCRGTGTNSTDRPPCRNHRQHLECITQRSGFCSAQIGNYGYIPRWEPGSTLKYVVCVETFPTIEHAFHATHHLALATTKWHNIGVGFVRVKQSEKANFRVVYQDQHNGKSNTLASSFFPDEDEPDQRTLYIYATAFKESNLECQANVLSHEIGHILGLRHEFAMEKEGGCVTWGQRNPNSVMNYHKHLSQCLVGEQDLKEVESFYKFTGAIYGGIRIHDFKPQDHIYSAPAKRIVGFRSLWRTFARS